MFGRAYTGDAIKSFSRANLEEVFHFDAALACQPCGANALARNFRLMRAERESESLDSVICGRVHDQRAPAASQIEQTLPRSQPQLTADVVELVPLRVGQRHLRRFEICAAVTQRFVQP